MRSLDETHSGNDRRDTAAGSIALVFVVAAAYFVPFGGLVAVWLLSRGPLAGRRRAIRLLLILACVMLAVQLVYFVHFAFGWPPSKSTFEMETGVVESG